MKKLFVILAFAIWFCNLTPAQGQNADSLKRETKKGWSIAGVPGFTYDADKGFTYGITMNIFDYGKGDIYPNYKHFIYAEGSYSTKKVGTFRVFYESDYVIKNHKLLADVSYLPESMSDFYGFNGSYSVYNHDLDNKNAGDYISKSFYKHESNLFRLAFDIRGRVFRKLYWYGGVGALEFVTGRVLTEYTANQNELYNLYRQWGLISEDERSGGWHPYVRGGLSLDTRNQRVNTIRGLYVDLFLTYTLGYDHLKEYTNVKLNFNFMHFLPIYRDRLIFAYRVATQNVIYGKSPYYMDTYLNTLYLDHNRYYGLGGSTSLRGVMRNRIWVPGYAFATAELRSRIVKFDLLRQHFYLGMNAFIDAGMVTQKYDIDELAVRQAIDEQLADPNSWMSQNNKKFEDFFDSGADVFAPHFGAGAGAKLAMNENFVISLEWAMPFNHQDNYTDFNFYIGMGYMF